MRSTKEAEEFEAEAADLESSIVKQAEGIISWHRVVRGSSRASASLITARAREY